MKFQKNASFYSSIIVRNDNQQKRKHEKRTNFGQHSTPKRIAILAMFLHTKYSSLFCVAT
jgi:hypothetical protein